MVTIKERRNRRSFVVTAEERRDRIRIVNMKGKTEREERKLYGHHERKKERIEGGSMVTTKGRRV